MLHRRHLICAIVTLLTLTTDSHAVDTAVSSALHSTVKLAYAKGDYRARVSGTLIWQQDSQALVATCAHLFPRDVDHAGHVLGTVYNSGEEVQYNGRSLAVDHHLDVAIILLNDVPPLPTMPLGRVDQAPKKNDVVFVAGRPGGRSPVLEQTRVTAINRFAGRPNLEVAAMPEHGQSGGGLFTRGGHLVGICNARNPIEPEGIYSGVAAIHEVLKTARRSHNILRTAQSDTRPERHQVTASAQHHHPKGATELTTRSLPQPQVKVMCVAIESVNGAMVTQSYVLDRASNEFLELMQSEGQRVATD